jgi:gluconate kinase
MFIVFGRPGAGKSTLSYSAAKRFREYFERKQDNHKQQKRRSCLALDLDVCIPQWMKDNFGNGIYPTLDERTIFANDACDYVSKMIENELHSLSTQEEDGIETTSGSKFSVTTTTSLCCCVSFSFVNADLRDVFRSRFPHARWILVDTTDEDAADRIQMRQDHFYKGKKPATAAGENGNRKTGTDSGDDRHDTDAKSNDGNSEWSFAPVTFAHTRLDGRDPIEANAEKILEEILSTIDNK